MRSLIRISHIHFHPFNSPTIRFNISFSTACLNKLHVEGDEFLSWLRRKTGCEISSVLSVGFSCHGRALFALESIRSGDCLLKIPYNAQISTGNIRSEIACLLVDDIDNVSRLAVALLAEKKLGRVSEWAPYIQSLPRVSEMHNMMFWSEEELDMLRTSTIYQEIVDQKAHIKKEFLALKPVLDHVPWIFGDFILEDFMHAYALNFLNHDSTSEADLLSDDMKETSEFLDLGKYAYEALTLQKGRRFRVGNVSDTETPKKLLRNVSEVIADRDYAVGEQVLIRYGKFPNATLMLDFGFTIPYNIHNQVQIQLDIPKDDPLYTLKLELLYKHHFPTSPKVNPLKSSEYSFIVREVKSPKGKGKGIPQALRAYARILSITSRKELEALGNEAATSDGRLARRPLENTETEIQAHRIMLSQFTRMIHDRDASVKALESEDSCFMNGLINRRKMAIDLLNGELRVLKSACAWLTNYCACLSASGVSEFLKN